jgi:hypothetical protein
MHANNLCFTAVWAQIRSISRLDPHDRERACLAIVVYASGLSILGVVVGARASRGLLGALALFGRAPSGSSKAAPPPVALL